jgi:hypothetical protein
MTGIDVGVIARRVRPRRMSQLQRLDPAARHRFFAKLQLPVKLSSEGT